VREITVGLAHEGPVFATSGLSGAGCRALCARVMAFLESERAARVRDAAPAETP
jgi:hypothetical protein